jgi:hypothetical protein
MNKQAASFNIVINSRSMHELGLSLDEYSVAYFINLQTTNPESIVSGWCLISKKDIAKALGLTERTTYRILKSLWEKGLIEKYSESEKYYPFIRTTSKWYDCTIGIPTAKMADRLPKEKVAPKENIYITLAKAKVADKSASPLKSSKKCTNPKGHEDCKSDIKSLETEFGKIFPDYGTQLRYLHLLYKAGVSKSSLEKTCNELDKDPYWQEEGWDMITVYKKITKGGSKYVQKTTII